MDVDEALALLGLHRDTTWADVLAAYRARIRAVHPDITNRSGTEAARLNAAFSTLERVYRHGSRHSGTQPSDPSPEPARRARRPHDRNDLPIDVARVDDDGLALVAPADEVFHRLAFVIDQIGDVTYADPEGGYLEALLADGAAQLVVSLQGRAHATEAFFTLEPMGTRPVPLIEAVVREVATRLRAMA